MAGPAADGRAYSGRVFRIDPVHIERDVIARGAATGDTQRLFDHGAHATLVNIAHAVGFNPGLADLFFFPCVDIAHAYQNAVLALSFGEEVEDAGQFRRTEPENRGEWHAVHVAAGRSFGRIDVGMGVNPDESDLLLLLAIKLGHARNPAAGHPLIPPHHHRAFPPLPLL